MYNHSNIRCGGIHKFPTPPLKARNGGKGGKKGGEPRLSELEGSSRKEAISRALVFLCRHGAEREGSPLCPQGCVAFEALLRVHESLRKLNADESDVMNIIDGQSEDKMRLDVKWGNSILYVRTFQGHSANTSVDFRNDPENILINNPSYTLHSTNSKSLTHILRDGLKRMRRNAIHLAPALFNARQSLYIQRNKTPFSLLVDAKAATDAGHRFYATPNDVVLHDGGMNGLIEPEYIVGIHDFDMSQPHEDFLGCVWMMHVPESAPYHHTRDPMKIFRKTPPRLESGDYQVQSRVGRQPPKAPEKTSPNLSKKYGPLSLTPNKDLTEGTSAAGPALRPRRDRTPPPPPSVGRKPVSVFSSEAFRPLRLLLKVENDLLPILNRKPLHRLLTRRKNPLMALIPTTNPSGRRITGTPVPCLLPHPPWALSCADFAYFGFAISRTEGPCSSNHH